jgi:polysaccharide biosynthesis protein PslH
MKIVWIYPELPYPLTSGFLRGFHLLRILGQSHAITFLSLTSQTRVPPETIQVLKAYADRIEVFNKCTSPGSRWLRISGRIPVVGGQLQEYWNTRSAVERMRKALHNLLREQSFDVVLFHGREALPVLEGVEIPIVVDCGDTNSTRILQEMRGVRLARRAKLFFHYVKERGLEERLARKTPYRCFISTRDRENLLGSSDRSEIVPQGVDDKYWKRRFPPSGRNCIAFSGVLNYPPNADAALFLMDKILPLVRRKFQRLEVLIVGRDPTMELVNAARHYADVTVTGAVADVRPYLERADIFVAALRFASGVQNKVLEAMAMEVPVVTTPVVAAGLCVDGIEPPLVIGLNDEEIADGIIRLLIHPEKRASLSAAGRRFVEAHCSWSHSAERLEGLCLAAAGHVRGTCRPDLISTGPSLIYPK